MGATYSFFNQATTTAITRTDGPYNLGMEFAVDQGSQIIWVLGFAFRRPDAVAQTVTARLYSVSTNPAGDGYYFPVGTPLAAATMPLGSTAGWKLGYLPSPIKLDGRFGGRWRVSMECTRFMETGSYFVAGGPGFNGIRSGPAIAPAAQFTKGAGQCMHSGSPTRDYYFPYIPGTSGVNWWPDILFTDQDPAVGRGNFHGFMGGF